MWSARSAARTNDVDREQRWPSVASGEATRQRVVVGWRDARAPGWRAGRVGPRWIGWDRHSEVRGSEPQVGHSQKGAPD